MIIHVKNKKEFSSSTLERLNSIGSIIRNVADRVSALQGFGDIKHDNKNTKLIDFNRLIDESLNALFKCFLGQCFWRAPLPSVPLLEACGSSRTDPK